MYVCVCVYIYIYVYNLPMYIANLPIWRLAELHPQEVRDLQSDAL